ncbi:MAG: hypothetical protein EBS68_15335, partial [Rhodobacteraceae bacterium]|nr:hypothetical protein [Paracoccaceae bacterium]
MSLRDVALAYFDAHPEAKREVERKGLLALRAQAKATHRFEYRGGQTRCWVCGQDWHAADMPRCRGFQRNEPEGIVAKVDRVLTAEHQLYLATIARCEALVRREHSDWSTLTGEQVAVLHHTHGCGREELEWIFESDMPISL